MEDKIKTIVERELNANIIDIKRINEGWSHSSYNIKIDRLPFEVIIRFDNGTMDIDEGIGKEKYVIDTMSKSSIPVPKIYACDYKNSDRKNNFIIIEKFNGMRLDIIWKKLSKQEKLQITEEIGKILAKIHKIKLEKFGKIKSEGKIEDDSENSYKFKKQGEHIEFSKFLRNLSVEHFRSIARLISYKRISPDLFSTYIKFLTKNLEKIDYKKAPTLIHGDFHPGHIFVEKNNSKYQITGIIDLEFANSNCPGYDFIKLHREGFFDDPELLDALERGYGKIDEEVVEIFRLTRDLDLAQVLLDSGNQKLCDKILNNIENKLYKGKKLTKMEWN